MFKNLEIANQDFIKKKVPKDFEPCSKNFGYQYMLQSNVPGSTNMNRIHSNDNIHNIKSKYLY